MAAFLPFVVWLLLNVILKVVWPRLALRRGELLTLFSMTWIAAVIPDWIWRWSGTMTTPIHYASAENRWAETFFDYLPWQIFPKPATALSTPTSTVFPRACPCPGTGGCRKFSTGSVSPPPFSCSAFAW